MHIAVVGCGHGEIDKIYEVIAQIEERQGIKVGVVLCCGDFQSVRNMTDLRCMACPIKYQQMHDFYRYYSGEKKAPILTLFIGGNHEASNFLQELPYGGWVAPNIFYMGYVGVFRVGSLRIAGISGIYKGHDYLKGRHEHPPYNQNTMRSVYHYRNLDVFRLKQIKQPVDVVLSHDWPKGIHQYGDFDRLLRQKPFFRDEIERNELGSRPLLEVLEAIQPSYWFSAHMHVKFAASVSHPPSVTTTEVVDSKPNNDSEKADSSPSRKETPTSDESVRQNAEKVTKFLALDKVLPRRQFLQIIEVPSPDADDATDFQFDPEWLAILKSTNHLVSAKDKPTFMPGPGYLPRSDFSATEEEIKEIMEVYNGELKLPVNFQKTAPVHIPGEQPQTAFPSENPFTKEFCSKLGLVDPLSLLVSSEDMMMNASSHTFDEEDYLDDYQSQMDITLNKTSFADDSFSHNPDEISLDLDDEGGDEEDPLGKGSDTSPTRSRQQNITRSRLVLPAPKKGDDDDENDNGVLSSKATALSLQEGSGSFRRSTLKLPPPKNADADMENLETANDNSGDNSSLFFLDTDGEPNVKRRKD